MPAARSNSRWCCRIARRRRLRSAIHRAASCGSNYLEHQREYRTTVQIADARSWSPTDPALYTLGVEVTDGDTRLVRFGCRTVGTSGSRITLNGAAIYPRMALSWGWYADALHSNPGPERVRADFERLRALGYNGVKLCLWFPPQYYFDLADELGMLLWLEFPMWLPQPTAFFREQTPREYMRLVAQAVRHPSVVVYTLGCELGGDVGSDILEPLFRDVKRRVGDALVRDNSGSGEAYGGLLNESAEFYDYHFYADIQFFRDLLDFWTPRWRPVLPWLFGEYCDSDTFRDLRPLQGERAPWWISDAPNINPKGARWQFDIVDQERRLRAIGMWERSAELQRISEAQSLLHRKYTLEFTRTYEEISGYVITGEVDTPISTAGMLDDRGNLKFDAARFRDFNDDTVLLLGWDKRRVWCAGGDRAAYWDTWCYHDGDVVRPHMIVSHYGAATHATLRWEAAWDDGTIIASDEQIVSRLEPAKVHELTIATWTIPTLEAPRRAVLRAMLVADGWTISNEWNLWCFPQVVAPDAVCMLHDPAGRLTERGGALPYTLVPFDAAARNVPLLTTTWNNDIERFIHGGGQAVVVLNGDEPSPIPLIQTPFWREAVKVIEPHAAWGDFPHTGSVGLQFYGCATDRAMDTSTLAPAIVPILRRVDVRTMALADYAVEWRHGAGCAILTTLRVAGGLGDQPSGLMRNTAAAYLLCCWLDWLRKGERLPIQ